MVHLIRYEMMMTPETRVTEMTFEWVVSVQPGGTSSTMTIPEPSRLRKNTSSTVASGQPT